MTCVLTAAAVWTLGDVYFALPPSRRPWATLHATLGSGGSLGHLLGIAGSALMVLNLLYLVRRRWARVGRLGPLSTWLTFHVAAGVGGVALVLAHTAGDFGNPVARWCTIAALVVLITGGLGRWIYGQVAHGAHGDEAAEADLVRRMRAALASVDDDVRPIAERAERRLFAALPPPVTSPVAAMRALPLAPFYALRLRWARGAVRRGLLADHAHDRVRSALAAADEATLLRLRARRQQGFKQLVGTWRGVHRVATFVLLTTLAAHVVSLYLVGAV
ncbi:MAG: hypothetical protein KC583_06455 [Myxococcales bacterium]|nr:hypothetical protein [Myxococcales bacterium]